MFSHFVMDLVDYSATPGGPETDYHYLFHLVDHQSSFHITVTTYLVFQPI